MKHCTWVLYAAAAPVVGCISPAPSVTYAAPALVIYAVPVPVVEYISPASAVTHAAPAPSADAWSTCLQLLLSVFFRFTQHFLKLSLGLSSRSEFGHQRIFAHDLPDRRARRDIWTDVRARRTLPSLNTKFQDSGRVVNYVRVQPFRVYQRIFAYDLPDWRAHIPPSPTVFQTSFGIHIAKFLIHRWAFLCGHFTDVDVIACERFKPANESVRRGLCQNRWGCPRDSGTGASECIGHT